MFIFGHLGFGSMLLRPLKEKAPFGVVLFLGILLPDLIDKALFYWTSHQVPGTRSIGHTLFFCLVFLGLSFFKWKPFLRTLSWGILTHLLIDNVGDLFIVEQSWERNSRILFWPFLGVEFPETPYLNMHEQLERVGSPYFLWSEMIGFCILMFFFFKERLRQRHP